MTAIDSTAPASPQPAPDGFTTFYVWPTPRAAGQVSQPCNYYDTNWNQVTGELMAEAGDFVRLSLNWPEPPPASLPPGDTNVQLFAAVAKTRDFSLSLPTLFSATDKSVVVPVADHTTRSLLLIFMGTDSQGNIVLTSTGDPLIGNSEVN